MIPSSFTQEEIKEAHEFVISKIRKNSRFVNGKVLGNPYVFYKEIADLLGYQIESEGDGDRLGIIAGDISNLEFAKTGLLISAVVVSKEYMRPGAGFYGLAGDKGLFQINGKPDADGIAELTFWKQHVDKIVQKYGKR